MRAVKTFAILGLLAFSSVAAADGTKAQSLPRKLGREAKVYVMDKDPPPTEKTVRLARPLTSLKDKS